MLTSLSLDLAIGLICDRSFYEVDVLIYDALNTIPASVKGLIGKESVLQASVLELKPGKASCYLLVYL